MQQNSYLDVSKVPVQTPEFSRATLVNMAEIISSCARSSRCLHAIAQVHFKALLMLTLFATFPTRSAWTAFHLLQNDLPTLNERKRISQCQCCVYTETFFPEKMLNGFKNMYKNVNTHCVLEYILTFCFPRQLLLAWKVEWTFYLLFCWPISRFVEHRWLICLLLHESTCACTWNKTKE